MSLLTFLIWSQIMSAHIVVLVKLSRTFSSVPVTLHCTWGYVLYNKTFPLFSSDTKPWNAKPGWSRDAITWLIRKQTQERPPPFSSWRCLSDFSTGARNLALSVCTFLLRRKVCHFRWKSPYVILIVSFSPVWYEAVIVPIKGFNSLTACFTQVME